MAAIHFTLEDDIKLRLGLLSRVKKVIKAGLRLLLKLKVRAVVTKHVSLSLVRI